MNKLFIALGLCCLSSWALANCPTPGRSHLAIIIDDIGYDLDTGRALASFPGPLTLAILPETPHATEIDALGTEYGKEIMIHLPMVGRATAAHESHRITANLPEIAIDRFLQETLTSVPHAVGVNNHQGSELTRDRAAMERLMSRLKGASLFFVDSRTAPDTVAATTAERFGIPVASRSVFLDNVREQAAIRVTLAEAIAAARKQGSAIAIGHPYPETLAVLAAELPQLPDDVTLTPASSVVYCQSDQNLTSIP